MLKRFPEYGRKPAGTPSFSETLRWLIVGRLHAGWFRPGDRLPSIRDLANRNQVDHRVVARAYRELETEGLVEIQAKSGVFISSSLSGSTRSSEAGAWAADVLFDAWQRSISRASLCGLFGGMVSSPLRCACVESNQDHLIAIGAEVADGLGLEVVPVLVDPSADEKTPPAAELAQMDLIVSSVFHAKYARAAAAAVGKPLAIMNLRPEFSAAIGKRLAAGPVTAVIVDPEYARRGTVFFSAIAPEVSIRFLTVEEALREKVDLTDESLLITRAARRHAGLEEYHLIPSPPMISVESAHALCEIVTSAAPRRRARVTLADPGGTPPNLPRHVPGPAEKDGIPEMINEASTETLVQEVGEALRTDGIFGALRLLNGTTSHRFTGIYRFEPDWVRSVALFDRENPQLRAGADVRMKESYCVLTADAGENFLVENALADPRLATHHARDTVLCYCAVHLLDADGASWGTLCHYDLRAAEIAEGTMAALEAVRPLFESVLGPATPYVRTLPDCAGSVSEKPAQSGRAHPTHRIIPA